MPQTLIEKIAQLHAENLGGDQLVKVGEYINISPAHILTHDNTSAILKKFKTLGCEKIANNKQPVFALDHNIQDTGEATRVKYDLIERFASEANIDFYPAGRGIGHQVMCEEGYVWPGSLVVASDSHANMYGGLGALGTPLVRSDAAAIWATGQIWWHVPPVVKVSLVGELRPGVSAKDIIIALAGTFNNDEVLNHAIEFHGSGVQALSVDQRFTIANMTTEWGAMAGVFPIDAQTYEWLESRALEIEKKGLHVVPPYNDAKNGTHPRLNIDRIAQLKHEAPYADPDAEYALEMELELGNLEPMVAGPDHVKTIVPASRLEKEPIAIQKAYLLSCVNGRVEDLAEAAEVLKGQKIADEVDLYVAAASSEVQSQSETRGDWQVLLDAGAKVLPPGCGPCIGLGDGLLEDGEIAISATNRNFKGRMGSKNAQVYLASPAVVAVSAITGAIQCPSQFEGNEPRGAVLKARKQDRDDSPAEIMDGFPSMIEGRVLFCHQDNLNTDGIFPSKYTYMDDLSAEQSAAVVMENYDPDFTDMVKPGDVLVGGFNFGTGSSREQAATAIKHAGITAIIAGSFSETYKRNAINNGLLVLESPDMVKFLVNQYGWDKLTVDTETPVTVDFEHTEINFLSDRFKFHPVGIPAQELILAGGLENWIKERL